eukprot:CAMPEP_0172518956 /NCGR_PEP_ID=MMETSP1066-20121228/291132_1 /TAXON_ID=671091 /ORGANISM="Coscinodiscus wailesii, Strain CCMP2513" /LENGTH=76 /DNA_ID=CAMNT_0013301449 /DNA_START=422 /DNA_END=652 /DNA_ORIENTATION=-
MDFILYFGLSYRQWRRKGGKYIQYFTNEFWEDWLFENEYDFGVIGEVGNEDDDIDAMGGIKLADNIWSVDSGIKCE